jgi:hypothetical protein
MLTKEELLAKAKKPAQDAMKLHPYESFAAECPKGSNLRRASSLLYEL